VTAQWHPTTAGAVVECQAVLFPDRPADIVEHGAPAAKDTSRVRRLVSKVNRKRSEMGRVIHVKNGSDGKLIRLKPRVAGQSSAAERLAGPSRPIACCQTARPATCRTLISRNIVTERHRKSTPRSCRLEIA
jgi:hypothetical protein